MVSFGFASNFKKRRKLKGLHSSKTICYGHTFCYITTHRNRSYHPNSERATEISCIHFALHITINILMVNLLPNGAEAIGLSVSTIRAMLKDFTELFPDIK
jgi:hypothetical protein